MKIFIMINEAETFDDTEIDLHLYDRVNLFDDSRSF